MKRLLILLLMLLMGTVSASPPSRSYTYTTGNIIQAAEVTANEDNIFRYLTAGVDTYAAGSITAAALAAGAITSSAILDGTIVSADISGSAAIPYSKLTLTGSIVGGDLSSSIAISTSGTIATTAALSSTATTTTSGLSVTGMIKDKDGDWPTAGQILVGRTPGVNWENGFSWTTTLRVSYAGATGTVADSYPAGVTITNTGAGVETVNFGFNFTGTTYQVVIGCGNSGQVVGYDTKAIGSVRIATENTAGGAVDAAEITVIIFEN